MGLTMKDHKMIGLEQAKLFLRVNDDSFDTLIIRMINCAEDVAELYIEDHILAQNLRIIQQGILAHVAMMFDSGYVLETLPAEILQYYKPFIRPKL
jgi:hypothetical protein